MEVTDKDVRGDRSPFGCHLCKCIGGFVVFSQHMVEFKVVKFFIQALDRLAVCIHLEIMATRLLHDLVNYEPRVASDIEPFDPKLDCDVEAVNKGLVLRHII